MTYSIIIANKFVNIKLIRTLKSIYRQKNLKDIEVIIVNKDNSNNLRSLKKNFVGLNLKIINEEDKNISDAFNKGLKISKNQYIYFMGSGDTFTDNKVLIDIKKYTKLKNNQLIIGKVVIVNKKKKKIKRKVY